MPGGLWLVLVHAWIAVLSLFATGSRLQRRMVVGLGWLSFLWPWLPDEDLLLLRGYLALAVSWGLVRLTEVLNHSPPLRWTERLWHVHGIVDTRLVRPATPRFDGRGALWSVVNLGLAASSLWASFFVTVDEPVFLRYALRWGFAVVFVYTAVEAVSSALVVGHRLFGYEPPKLHDNPLWSRSVREFWSERWNRMVGRWLRRAVFLPVGRRFGALAGLAATFVVSGLLHAHFILVALGPAWALCMGSFFLIQIGFVLGERRLGIGRWPAWKARAWTTAALVGTSWLHMEPILRLIEPLIFSE